MIISGAEGTADHVMILRLNVIRRNFTRDHLFGDNHIPVHTSVHLSSHVLSLFRGHHSTLNLTLAPLRPY